MGKLQERERGEGCFERQLLGVGNSTESRTSPRPVKKRADSSSRRQKGRPPLYRLSLGEESPFKPHTRRRCPEGASEITRCHPETEGSPASSRERGQKFRPPVSPRCSDRAGKGVPGYPERLTGGGGLFVPPHPPGELPLDPELAAPWGRPSAALPWRTLAPDGNTC